MRGIKGLFAFAIVVSLSATAWAQVPAQLSAQGVLRDSSGIPISDARTMTFRIYDGATEVWEETIVDVPVNAGVFAVYLGNVMAIDPTIFEGSTDLFLGVTVEGDSAELPRQRLVTVPFAFEAGDAAGMGGRPATSWQRRFSGACSVGFVTNIAADGTATCSPEVGDITEIVAGVGLTGSATTGIATLAVAFAGSGVANTVARSDHNHTGVYLPIGGTLTCTSGNVVTGLTSAGSVVCAPDANAGGDITGVTAGSGLTGGGTSGAVSLAADLSVLQARVTGLCPAGSAIRAIDGAGAVICEADDDTNTTYTAGDGLVLGAGAFSIMDCAANQLLKRNSGDTAWACANDLDSGGDITGVTAGSGLTGGGTTGAVTLSADTAVLQARVSGTCAAGSSISAISATGTVTCEADNDSGGDITGVTAGTGLTGGGTTGAVSLAVDTAAIQARVSGTCAAGSAISSISSTGTVTCESDNDSGGDITAVVAGTGLTGGATSGSATLNADTSVLQARVGGTCGPGASISAISSTGTVTCETDDTGASYTASEGIALVGNDFQLDTTGCADGEVLVFHPVSPSWSCETIGSATITNNAVTAADIVDEPAVGAATGADVTATDTVATVASKAVVLPASGNMLVTVQATTGNPVGCNELEVVVRIDGSTVDTLTWQAPVTGSQTHSFTAVTGGPSGPHTLDMRARTTTAACTIDLDDPQVIVTYFPTTL